MTHLYRLQSGGVTLVMAWLYLATMAFGEDIDLNGNSPAINPLRKQQLSTFSAFIERPLFAPSRRPAEPLSLTAEEPADLVPPSLNIRLLGVIVTPDGAIARIQNIDDGTSQSLEKGGILQDWEVISIGEGELNLVKNGETKTFTVFQKDPAQAPPDEVSITEPLEDNKSDMQQSDSTKKKIRVIVPSAISEDKLLKDQPANDQQ